MKLFEVQATEYNGEQEYSQSKLFAAENIDQAWQTARDYFRQWYDDGDEPEDHNTDNPDEFEYVCGCIRLKIKSVQETTLNEWIRTRITLHSISELPDELITTRISGSVADLLEACKVLTSYTTDLLYKLDDQINIDDIEEIQQAKDAIAGYNSARTYNTKLRNACRAGLKFLDSLPETGLTTQLENREAFRKMLNDALNQNVPVIDDRCPKCGAGHAERQLKERVFIDIEAIHVHYICNKCGSEITEEFILSDVFIDSPQF